MKKVLIATTALVMTAGVAAAEVSLSGNGRMGVVYDGADWEFSSRARVVFTLSGTTDGGLEFGGSFRADQAGDGATGAWGADTGNAGSVYISGAFGKISMGDVASAPEALFGDLASVGYMGDSQGTANGGTNNIPYLTLDDGTQSALLYTYSAGAFSVAASMSDGIGEDLGSGGDDQVYAVAGAYTFGNYTVGLGYEVIDWDAAGVDNTTQLELAAVATFGNTDVKAYYADQQDGIIDAAFGISAATTFGATTVAGYVQQIDAIGGGDVTWYGIGVDYDLGGGAVLSGAIQDDDVTGSDPTANFGVRFSF
ncbi:outer membrane protein OmpU [Rhodobacter aestuarii]|uniref:Outer membrane protein OmpU n=1 Tax=Rhodobacter aestuarii TaxID=453582 RepID=A0A1N7PTY2_9RHOB|nr:porin [Rhodobacter aestuarii]PTV94167.1 outer membrane protein OmpU [Rhodobacter aestuarii]SIT14074.1 outer membrane protein OmpU [Rhodobacter aestuarii]